MKSYPIRTDRDHYRGSNASRQRKATEYNRVAQRVENFLNESLREEPDHTVNVYLSSQVATHLREDADLVRRVVSSIDSGHNGVTIVKGDYGRALANMDKLQAATSPVQLP